MINWLVDRKFLHYTKPLVNSYPYENQAFLVPFLGRRPERFSSIRQLWHAPGLKRMTNFNLMGSLLFGGWLPKILEINGSPVGLPKQDIYPCHIILATHCLCTNTEGFWVAKSYQCLNVRCQSLKSHFTSRSKLFQFKQKIWDTSIWFDIFYLSVASL